MSDAQLSAPVLTYAGGTWKPGEVKLHNPLPEVCYIFLENGKWYKGDEKDNKTREAKEAERRRILEAFSVPDFLSNQMCTDLNGYFGSKSSFDNQRKLVDLSTWFRCLVKRVLRPDELKVPNEKEYLWYEMGFFTRWCYPNVCQVLCIDTPKELRVELQKVLQVSSRPELRDPFAMLRPLFDRIIELYDDSVWRVRDKVRYIEKNRLTRTANFIDMHEISRHTGHVLEVEKVAIETMESLFKRQETLYENLPVALDLTYQIQAQEYWDFQIQAMKALKQRSKSNQERLNAEITLAFNMIASQDNTVMKSIALLTMTVLPATFVSALFSTSFFTFRTGTWQLSSQFWIYWVVVVPLTLFVLCLWRLWLQRSLHNPKSPWWEPQGGKKPISHV